MTIRRSAEERASAYTDEQLDQMTRKQLLELGHGTLTSHALDYRLDKAKWDRRTAIVTPNKGKHYGARVSDSHPLKQFTTKYYSKRGLSKAKEVKRGFEK